MKVSMQKAAAHLVCPVYIWLLCVLNRADMVTEKTIYQQTCYRNSKNDDLGLPICVLLLCLKQYMRKSKKEKFGTFQHT